MIGHLLSKLPAPRAADLGFGVSVCIAVGYQDKLICITDNRASFGDFSGENVALKNDNLGFGWVALFAGNDVEHVDPILRSARRSIVQIHKKKNNLVGPDEIAALVDEAYSEQLQAHIENKILRRHGFDADSFQKTGKVKCTPEVYLKTWDRIDRETFSLRFLVCGFDAEKKWHIWMVDGEGAPTSYDQVGFWSIGTGAPAALNRLSIHLSKYRDFTSLEEAAYVALTDFGSLIWPTLRI